MTSTTSRPGQPVGQPRRGKAALNGERLCDGRSPLLLLDRDAPPAIAHIEVYYDADVALCGTPLRPGGEAPPGAPRCATCRVLARVHRLT